MKLGLTKDEVKLVPYDNEWENEFLRVKKEIIKHTNLNDTSIQHIGSTSIVGILAKPILDMVVGVDDINDVDKKIISGLKKEGFLRLAVERPAEIIFAKFVDDTYQVKTHYIHLVDYNKKLWNNLIFFRDYLNSNEAERNEYQNLKVDYVKNNTGGIGDYTDHKEEFVKRIYGERHKRKDN
ncbi:MAG: GrpB family protein [Paenisporosarcina sp.]